LSGAFGMKAPFSFDARAGTRTTRFRENPLVEK
jgi:hypothetical protein